jgi:hypothetical protein
VADVPGAVRVRGGAHHDGALLGVRQRRESVVVALVVGLQLRDPVRRERLEAVAPLVFVHPAHLGYDRRDHLGDLVAVRAEVGILAHQRTHDRAHVGIAAVFERVEQRGRLAGRLHPLTEFVVHTPDCWGRRKNAAERAQPGRNASRRRRRRLAPSGVALGVRG